MSHEGTGVGTSVRGLFLILAVAGLGTLLLGGAAFAVAPAFENATISGRTLELNYGANTPLDTGSAPATTAFAVYIQGYASQSPTSVTVETYKVTLKLDPTKQALWGDSVTVGFNNSAGVLKSAAGFGGDPAASLTNQAVTNNTIPVSPKTQSGAGRVDTLFEPLDCEYAGTGVTACTQTYRVFRNARADDRSFTAVGTVTINVYGDTPWEVASTSIVDAVYDSFTTVQPDINSSRYLVFRDRKDVTDYEEYHYLVTYADGSTADDIRQPMPDQYGSTLASYVVMGAFPPNQTRHGSYTEFTGACTGCHGLHSARSQQKLLKGSTATDLCATCHDGTGSKYDEYRGMVHLVTSNPGASIFAPAPAGPFGNWMKAGIDDNYASSAHPVYRADGAVTKAVYEAPGSGFRGSATGNTGSGTDFSQVGWNNLLSCVSCHEPHNRSRSFRLLRNDINDKKLGDGDNAASLRVRGVSHVNTAGVSAGVSGSTLWPPAYDRSTVNGTVYYVSQTKLLNDSARFCSQCHRAFYNNSTRYVDSRVLDRMFSFRHNSGPPQDQDYFGLGGAGGTNPEYRHRSVTITGSVYVANVTYDTAAIWQDYRYASAQAIRDWWYTFSNEEVSNGGQLTASQVVYLRDADPWFKFAWDEQKILCGSCHAWAIQTSDGEDLWIRPPDTSGPQTYLIINHTRVTEGYGSPRPERWIRTGWGTGNAGLDTASGASSGNVFGSGHRHPTDVPAYTVAYSGKVVEGTLRSDGTVDYDETVNNLFRLKDGPVNIGMHLEGAQVSTSVYRYVQNKVVCLTCHMAHGSRVASSVSTTVYTAVYDYSSGAWSNNAGGWWSIDWFTGDKDLPSAYTGAPAGGYTTSTGYSTNVDTTKLARFAPFASVCYRCHSAK